MLKHLLLSINVTELNIKMPINFSMHKVTAFVGKPVIAQHMPEFHSVSLKISLKHAVWYNRRAELNHTSITSTRGDSSGTQDAILLSSFLDKLLSCPLRLHSLSLLCERRKNIQLRNINKCY